MITPLANQRSRPGRSGEELDDVDALLQNIAELAQRADALQERHEALTPGPQAALSRLLRGDGRSADESLLGIPLPGTRLLHLVFNSRRARDEALAEADLDGGLALPLPPTVAYLLVRNSPRRAGEDRALVSAQRLADRAVRADPFAAVAISAPILTASDLISAARDTADAADIALSTQESVLRVEDCWHELLLRRLQPSVSMNSHSPLKRVIDYDSTHHGDLLETLTVWLRCGGNATTAAASLHIHKNTLRYRILRAQEVARVDLSNPRQRLALAVMLQA